jgi:hypothetical protein
MRSLKPIQVKRVLHGSVRVAPTYLSVQEAFFFSVRCSAATLEGRAVCVVELCNEGEKIGKSFQPAILYFVNKVEFSLGQVTIDLFDGRDKILEFSNENGFDLRS